MLEQTPASNLAGPALESRTRVRGWRPTMVGVVIGDCSGKICRLVAQIFLVQNAGSVHLERHHSGYLVLGRPRDDRKPLCHDSVFEVAPSAAGRVLSLACQDFEM